MKDTFRILQQHIQNGVDVWWIGKVRQGTLEIFWQPCPSEIPMCVDSTFTVMTDANLWKSQVENIVNQFGFTYKERIKFDALLSTAFSKPIDPLVKYIIRTDGNEMGFIQITTINLFAVFLKKEI